MRTCSNCGSGLESSDVFCTNCGTGQDQANPEYDSPAAAAGGFGDPATAAVATRLEVVTERETGTASASQQPPGQDGESQQPNVAGTSSGVFVPAPHTASIRADETIEQKYMRQTRNATVFIAVIVGIVTIIALVGIIWTATSISKINSQLNGSDVSNSTCESQGGSNPNC
jgi:cobalamin biosynthesis Mg chelatase CobN